MDFPIAELMDEPACYAKLVAWLHPDGLACPRCQDRDTSTSTGAIGLRSSITAAAGVDACSTPSPGPRCRASNTVLEPVNTTKKFTAPPPHHHHVLLDVGASKRVGDLGEAPRRRVQEKDSQVAMGFSPVTFVAAAKATRVPELSSAGFGAGAPETNRFSGPSNVRMLTSSPFAGRPGRARRAAYQAG